MAAELVAIELQLKGYEGVLSDMRMLDTMLNNLRGRKNKIQIQSNLAKAKQDIIAYKAEVERLTNLQKKIQKGMDSGVLKGSWGKRLSNVTKELETVRRKLKDTQQAANEFQYALKNFSPMTFMQAFGKISSVIGHFGSAMQSAGNAITRLTTPFRRLTTGLLYSAGYKVFNMFTEGLGGAFERYDTMQSYAKSLKALGLDADQTFKVFENQDKPLTAIENLNESVLGLPTGLDEIVAAQKVYAGSTGEMVKSTKLAIAANNTFIASTMGSREQRFMQRYMASLASGADLTTTQWQSIGRIAPLALKAVADELGVTTDELRGGKVAGEEFLDAFIKVGTEGKIQKAANVMKTTWEGLTANLQNAAKRMGEGVLKALDEAFVSYNGRNLVQNLLGFDAEGNEIGGGIKHWINNISSALQDWIKAHPEEIMDFFNALKSIDWNSIVRGMGEGMLALADIIERFAHSLEGKDLSKVGKFMVMGNLWGKALTIFGGLIKGTRHITGALFAAGLIGILKAKGFAKFGLAGMLGRAIGGTAEGAAETATTVATTSANVGKMSRFMGGLSSIFKGWAQVSTMIIGSAAVAWGSMKLFKGAIRNFKEMVDIIKEVDWDTGAEALIGIGVFLTAMGGLSALAGGNVGAGVELLIGEAIVGLFTTLAAGFADLDMFLLKRTAKNLKQTIDYLTEALEGLDKLEGIDNLDDIASKVHDAIHTLNTVSDLFKSKVTKEGGVENEGLKGFTKSTAKSMKYLAETLENMKSSIQTLKEFGEMDIDFDEIEKIIPDMQTVMSSLGSMLIAIPSVLKTEETAEGVGNLGTSINGIKGMFGNLVGENGILAQIPKVIGMIDSLIRTTDLERLKGKMKDLGTALGDAYNALNDGGIGNGNFAYENLNNIREALKQARLAIHHLNELSGTEVDLSGIETIKDVVGKLDQAFNADQVSGLQETISTFKQSVKAALDSFNDLNGEIEIDAELKLSNGFSSSVSKVVSDINDGRRDVERAFNRIPTSMSKTITVTLNANVVASGAVSTLNRGFSRVQQMFNGFGEQSGGLISRNGGALYRARGGGVFKPRGTDTVPSMLTPGEYVHRKQAVDYFGTDFMRRVNAMDVRGAMDALLNKASTSIGIGRQSVVNNTVNNNQRVTQNITTNNPAFASMRASRFVGAM